MLTLTEAGAILGLSPNTLRVQIKNGRLKGRMVGKTWTVTRRELDRYAAESKGRPGRPMQCTVGFTGPAANEQCKRPARWWVSIGSNVRVPRCGPHSRNSAREMIA